MSALIGTILGGLLAIAGGIAVKSFDGWRMRQSLRAAFRAETITIVEMFESRGHERLFKDLLAHWKRVETGQPLVLGPIAKPVDPVFSKNSDKIGLLGHHVAGELVRFYAIVDGLRDDIAIVAGPLDPRLSREGRIRMIEDDLELLREAKDLAAELKRKL